MLLVRGSVLPRASGGGYVVVFDDVTKLVQAQRATAWGGSGAAPRARDQEPAHAGFSSRPNACMRNSPTKLAAEDSATLKRATETIINQVAAMKGMVDDFAEYARHPRQTAAADLNALVPKCWACTSIPARWCRLAWQRGCRR